MWLVSLISIVLLCMWGCTEGIISGDIDPFPINNVGEGDTAVFTCTVRGRDALTEAIVWQLSYRTTTGDVSFYNFPANVTRIYVTELPTNMFYGQYYLSHSYGGLGMEIFQLHISNVTKGDSSFEFSCAWEKGGTITIFDAAVNLAVWKKPNCDSNLHGDIPDVITSIDTISVFVTCSTQDALTLLWYKIDDNGMRVAIESGLTFTNARYLSLTLDDYGSEYICGATAALTKRADFELTCHIFPYNPQPELRYNMSIIGSGDNFTVICTYNEIPQPKSNYFWYIGSTLLNDNKDTIVQISQSETDSSLFLGKEYLPAGNTTITCVAVIQNIALSNTSVTVTVEPREPTIPSITSLSSPSTAKKATTGFDTHGEVPLVIISAATVSGFVVLIITLITLCCCYRRRNSVQQNNNGNKEQINTTSPGIALQSANENDASYQSLQKDEGNINQTYTPLKQGGISSNETSVYEVCSDKTSRSAVANTSIPFYASSIEFSK